MKAALYVRVSTTEQAEEGHSIEAQLDLLRAHCARMAWEIADEYVDAGVSGKREVRPQLGALMRDAKARRFDVVIVHKLDRFYRNLRALLDALERLAGYDVAFLSISESFDFSTPWGKLALVMLGTLAEIYLDNLSAETSKGKRQRAKEGLANASIVPYGYLRAEDGRLIPEPFEAGGVRLAFETYAQGNVSAWDIATLLNQQGHRTRQTTRFGSRPWSKDTVTCLLRNPFYAGLVRHGKETYPGQHEAIISRELWEKAETMRAERSLRGRTFYESSRIYLLSGLLRCDQCGETLRCQSARYGAYYRDTSKERGIACPCKASSVRTEVIDAQISELVSSFRLPDAWQEWVLAELQATDEQAALEAERGRLQERLRRLAKAYIEAGLTEAEYERERRDILVRLAELQSPKVDSVLDAGRFLATLGPVWERATDKERRDILRLIFEAVYVDLDAQRVSRVISKPAFEVLFRTRGKKNDLTETGL